MKSCRRTGLELVYLPSDVVSLRSFGRRSKVPTEFSFEKWARGECLRESVNIAKLPKGILLSSQRDHLCYAVTTTSFRNAQKSAQARAKNAAKADAEGKGGGGAKGMVRTSSDESMENCRSSTRLRESNAGRPYRVEVLRALRTLSYTVPDWP